MKTFLWLLAGILAMNFPVNAQKTVLPKKITNAFEYRFPAVKKVKWEKENETAWEASFKMGKTRYSAEFDTEGNWLATEHRIRKSDLPEAILKMLETDYAGYKLDEAELVDTPDGHFFELELEKGKGKRETEIELLVTPSGEVITSEETVGDD